MKVMTNEIVRIWLVTAHWHIVTLPKTLVSYVKIQKTEHNIVLHCNQVLKSTGKPFPHLDDKYTGSSMTLAPTNAQHNEQIRSL